MTDNEKCAHDLACAVISNHELYAKAKLVSAASQDTIHKTPETLYLHLYNKYLEFLAEQFE